VTRPSHATAGAKGGQAGRWLKTPCPSALSIEFIAEDGFSAGGICCQADQTWNSQHRLIHNHIWTGRINGQQVTVTWKDDGS
jgi:hypothetical protein